MNTADRLIGVISLGRDLALVLGQIGQNSLIEHIFCFLDLAVGCLKDFLRSCLRFFRRRNALQVLSPRARSERAARNLVSDVLRLNSAQVRIGQERIQEFRRLSDPFALQHELNHFAAGAGRQFEPRLFRHRWVGKQGWQQTPAADFSAKSDIRELPWAWWDRWPRPAMLPLPIPRA